MLFTAPPCEATPKPVPVMVMVPLFVSVEPNPDIVTALLAPDIDSVTPLLIVMTQLKPASAIGVELLLETVTGQLTIADACPGKKFRHRIGKIILSFNFNLTQFLVDMCCFI